MSIRKRLAQLEALESKRSTPSKYTFSEMHKIRCPVILASFKALYEPQPERGQP